MKEEYKGFIIKVSFWGDSITPMYKYKLYKPRKYWFPKCIWTEDIHRKDVIGKLSNGFDTVISNYQDELDRWKQ